MRFAQQAAGSAQQGSEESFGFAVSRAAPVIRPYGRHLWSFAFGVIHSHRLQPDLMTAERNNGEAK